MREKPRKCILKTVIATGNPFCQGTREILDWRMTSGILLNPYESVYHCSLPQPLSVLFLSLLFLKWKQELLKFSM